jgi:lipoteichoic acid synthase
VSEGYRQAVSDEIDRRFYYSAMVLDHDYYGMVLDR